MKGRAVDNKDIKRSDFIEAMEKKETNHEDCIELTISVI